MVELTIAKPVGHDLSEKELQAFFEKNLESIGDFGLKYVCSYLSIPTGIIDILAVDDQEHPVIIECKKIGKKFDRDALIQLMRYYSSFEREPNLMHFIHNVIRNKYPEKNDLLSHPFLIAIVNEVDDDVKEACWAVSTHVALITFDVVEGSNDNLLVVPKVVVDTTEETGSFRSEPKTEEIHFKGRENIKSLYLELVKKLKELDSAITFNPSPQHYIGISKNKMFCAVHVKKQWLRLDLRLLDAETENDEEYVCGEGYDWGYTQLNNIDELNGKKWEWIKKAYLKVSQVS